MNMRLARGMLVALLHLSAAAAWAEPVPPPPTKMKIGILAPLTGEAASYGEQYRDGLLLGNSDGRFELVIEDTQFESRTAAAAIRKLLDVDKVQALASFGGATCETINREAQARRIVHLAAGCNVGAFDNPDSFNFRLATNDRLTATTLVGYLERHSLRRLALVYIDNPWGTGLANHVATAAQKQGVEIVERAAFVPQNLDFRSVLVRLRAARPDALFFASLPNITPVLLRQLDDLKISIPRFSNISVENPAVVRLAGPLADGIMYVGVKSDPTSRAKYAEFYEHYPAGNPFVGLGYDTINLLRATATTTDPHAALQQTHGASGIFGSYTFDRSGEVHFEYEIRQIKDGTYVPLE